MPRRGFWLVLSFLCLVLPVNAQQPTGTLVIEVRGESGPASQVEVQVGRQTAVTDNLGKATLELPAGEAEVQFRRVGFAPKSVRATVMAGQTVQIRVELEEESVIEEEVFVTATRANTRIEDEPLRVEVVDQEEVDEKAVMTPGDIAMLLNETSGLRVQVTAPSLGAANVRVQGLRGRYTQLMADGLPLYGQTGSIGILQIPPLDLGQVEVIKGVASALYGASALGGVINLVSRRPLESQRELLQNVTSRRGSDTVFWLAEPKKDGGTWSSTLLGGAHVQGRSDIDADGYTDLPQYKRGVLRPRLFWENGEGDSVFVTAGAMAEDRAGGSDDFPEELRTRRFDGGAVGRFLVGKNLMSVRGSAMTARHRRQFGPTTEHDTQQTFFGEAALTGSSRGHNWTVGSAAQTDRYRNRDVTGFDYTYTTPSVFAQDEYSPTTAITFSASGRLDFHNRYGTFFNPRISALLRFPHGFTTRISTGTGIYAPTPFTEETEATGLSRLHPLSNLRAERAWSASGDLGWKSEGFEWNATVFGSVIRHPVVLSDLDIVNLAGATRTMGTEFLARYRHGRFNFVATHTYTHSTELDPGTGARDWVALTPRHTGGFDAMWEDKDKGRVGFEVYYTGRQRLEDNPYRLSSIPYFVFGILVERRFGPLRAFINAENIGDFRQTRHERLLLPQPLIDGRRSVDAWAPIDGRAVNGGIRYSF
jgi:outer membrane receptor for ferrienterochelin and colicins